MRIRAVFFDMGGTIQTFGYDHELRIRETPGLRRLLVDAGIHLPLDDERLEALVSRGLDRCKRSSLETLVELPPSSVWKDYVFTGLDVDFARLDSIAEDL